MSGEKRRYVNVEEQELRRLREQESRLRCVQRDLPERLNAVREQARREFHYLLAPLEQRAQQQEQETQTLKSSLFAQGSRMALLIDGMKSSRTRSKDAKV